MGFRSSLGGDLTSADFLKGCLWLSQPHACSFLEALDSDYYRGSEKSESRSRLKLLHGMR